MEYYKFVIFHKMPIFSMILNFVANLKVFQLEMMVITIFQSLLLKRERVIGGLLHRNISRRLKGNWLYTEKKEKPN